MRKHFLLLFLMAILPLAGWAVTGDVTLDPVSGAYNGTKQTLPTITAVDGIGSFNINNVVDLKWYKVVGTTETEIAAEEGVFKFTNAGTYKCTFGYKIIISELKIALR